MLHELIESTRQSNTIFFDCFLVMLWPHHCYKGRYIKVHLFSLYIVGLWIGHHQSGSLGGGGSWEGRWGGEGEVYEPLLAGWWGRDHGPSQREKGYLLITWGLIILVECYEEITVQKLLCFLFLSPYWQKYCSLIPAGFFCPHTDKHLAVLSKHTFDTQSIHIFGLVYYLSTSRNSPFYIRCYTWKTIFCFVLF